MRLRCERVVNDVLPAVRSVIAKELQNNGYSQTEIAELLDVTQPAVSQYLSAARGKQVQEIIDHEAYDEVEELIEAIMNREDDETLSRMLHDTCIALLDEDCDASCSPNGL